MIGGAAQGANHELHDLHEWSRIIAEIRGRRFSVNRCPYERRRPLLFLKELPANV